MFLHLAYELKAQATVRDDHGWSGRLCWGSRALCPRTGTAYPLRPVRGHDTRQVGTNSTKAEINANPNMQGQALSEVGVADDRRANGVSKDIKRSRPFDTGLRQAQPLLRANGV